MTRSVRSAARIAVDPLGGDIAPAEEADGVLRALRTHPLPPPRTGPLAAGPLVPRALPVVPGGGTAVVLPGRTPDGRCRKVFP